MRVLYIPVNLPVRMGEQMLRREAMHGYHPTGWQFGRVTLRVELEKQNAEKSSVLI